MPPIDYIIHVALGGGLDDRDAIEAAEDAYSVVVVEAGGTVTANELRSNFGAAVAKS